MAEIRLDQVPFEAQVNYFRAKANLPTRAWTDIWQQQHDRAFVVAGAMRDDLLADLRAAVDEAVSQGTGIEAFRARFDEIVQRHGWAYKGGRGWRTRVIYGTNMRQSYNAGREAQMADPRLRRLRPYGLYRHDDGVANPRAEHLAWDGLVIPLDDPWWNTHSPANGWGCRCRKIAVSQRDLDRMGKSGPDSAPAIEWREETVGARGPSPRTVRVPEGIDPGFAYRPGSGAEDQALADTARGSRERLQRVAPGVKRPPKVPRAPRAEQLAPLTAARLAYARIFGEAAPEAATLGEIVAAIEAGAAL